MHKTVKIVTDAGEEIYLGVDHGSTVFISPASGADVQVSTSQSFQQTGTTVENMSVGGVSRGISGTLFADAFTKASDMIRIIKPMQRVTVYYYGDEGERCTEGVVEKAPIIDSSTFATTYDMMVYCPNPYWTYTADTEVRSGGIEADFSFPTQFTSYHFGQYVNGQTIVSNPGSTDVSYSVEFTAFNSANSVSLYNVDTLEFLKINHAVVADDVVSVYWRNNKLRVELNGENIFSSLDDDSSLMAIHPGLNTLTTQNDNITALVKFRPNVISVHGVDRR